MKNTIVYPYLPENKIIHYVAADNPFMLEAKEFARVYSLAKPMPNCSLIVRDGKVVARGANGSDYHEKHGCKRIELGIPTGEGYELCEGCHPKNHGEAKAIADAAAHGIDIDGADLYMWGHWWCCEHCWDKMLAAGIRDVYLLEGSEVLFNKLAEGNIIGRQFSSSL